MTFLYKIAGTIYMSDHSPDDLQRAYLAGIGKHPLPTLPEWAPTIINEGGKITHRSNQILVKPEIRELSFGQPEEG